MHPKRLGQPDCVVGRSTADVHMLAENSELLGEIAVAVINAVKALAGADTAFRPVMEGVRAAAGKADVVVAAMALQHIDQASQVAGEGADAVARQGADLD